MTPNRRKTVASVPRDQLVIEPLGRELVVYDRKSNTANVLAPLAATLWQACSERVAVESLLPLVEGESEEIRRAMLDLAVAELQRARLVVVVGPPDEGFSRRALVKRLGRAAALPLVLSVLAPSPAAAASCIDFAGTCTGAGQCCLGQSANSQCPNSSGACSFSCANGPGGLKCRGTTYCCCSNDNDCAGTTCDTTPANNCGCSTGGGKRCN